MEVLVSIFVLSIGAMTALAMQTFALATAQRSIYQTQALQLAGELAEKIRLHSASMNTNPDFSPFFKIGDSSNIGKDSPQLMTCYGGDADCSNDAFLQFEIEALKKRAKNSLPDGRIKVCRDTSPEGTDRYAWSCTGEESMPIVIKLGWQDRRDEADIPVSEKQDSPPKMVLMAASYLR